MAAQGAGLSRAQMGRVLHSGWQRYDALRPGVPRGGSLGNRQVLVVAGVTLAFYRALMDAGLARDAAVKLVSLVVWVLLRPIADLAWLAAKLRTRGRLSQVRVMMLLSLRYPFGPPGFVSRVHSPSRSVQVDFYHCRAAEYLASREAADSCLGAWCQQDYRLADRWGVELHRVGTRAGGAERCGFCFRLPVPRPE